MKVRIVWFQSVQALLQELSPNEQELIFEKLDFLERFPRMYPVKRRGRFPRHRWFLAGNWLVFYRVVENTVYVRGLWPARIP